MKIKLLAAALSLNLVACTEGQPKASEPKQEASMVETNIENSEPKLDFEYTYNETKGKQRFSREVTEEEKNLYYDRLLDSLDKRSQTTALRFNRNLLEPKLEHNELENRKTYIRSLLDQCAALIGEESTDPRYLLDAQDGEYPIMVTHTKDKELMQRAKPLYLSGRMLKCVNFLYLNNDAQEYNFSDFEYHNKNQKKLDKKQKVEELYQQIYLQVKEAGLLRQIFYTYYPKSFLREHADQTGLTKFIQEKEAQSGNKPLKHDELAIEFFGSREKWITSFDQFLDSKINAQK